MMFYFERDRFYFTHAWVSFFVMQPPLLHTVAPRSLPMIPIVERSSWGGWMTEGGWMIGGASAKSMRCFSMFAKGEGTCSHGVLGWVAAAANKRVTCIFILRYSF